MDADSDVGNETKGDGLADIASDGDGGRIAVENGNFGGGDEDEEDASFAWRCGVNGPSLRLDWYQIPRIQKGKLDLEDRRRAREK